MGASSKAPAAPLLGRYVLHGQLAAGGMATVHLARQNGEAGFARTVAIKRLHPQFAKDPEFVAMFVDEARLAARIRHPNVVSTLDVISDGGDTRGEIFLVMDYIPGESLSRIVRTLRERRDASEETPRGVPPNIATTLFSGVLHGLHAAHEAKSEKGIPLGIVHRDVSPQNVLVGVDGIAHVLDFGVAKATGSAHTTREGQIKGKLGYMAPEQFESRALTRQSDVYAAAVVLWETLTLKRLFEGETEAALLMKVIAGNVPAPSTLVQGLPPGLDEVVLRGLARDPAARWATAREFAVALEKCAPIAAPSEIGEWVLSIAGDEIARRARMVMEIERGSYPMTAAAPVESETQKSEVRVVPSPVSAFPVSRSERADAAPSPARTGRAYFLAGGATGLLVVLVVMGLLRARAPAAAGAATSMAPSAPLAPSSSPAAPHAVATASPVPAPSGTPKVDQGSWAPEATPAAPLPVPVSIAPPPPAPPKPSAKRSDCDPPFTRDAVGHKHYKVQCL